jgi:hypothetical protein
VVIYFLSAHTKDSLKKVILRLLCRGNILEKIMIRIRHLVYFCTSLCAISTLAADTIDRGDNITENDVQALREWINTKRQVTVKEIGGNLSISGEVRGEFQSASETVNGVKQRGAGGATESAAQGYDVEVNLMLDYRTERSWSAIKLEFDNNAGIFGGTFNRIKLEKAYFGVHFIETDFYTISAEIGRRRLNTIFDSKIEFNSFFDGILFRYDHAFEWFGDFYTHAGVFVIEERINQYGYVGEIGLLNLAGTGFYTKYSLIDWDTKDRRDPIDKHRFDFIVSQWILGYQFLPKEWNKVVSIYAAGLWNHAAKRLEITDFKRANYGAYLGFTIGQLKKQGDWSFDANYQVVAAQAMPDFDNGGIGIGNAANTGLYTESIDGTGDPTTRKTAAGNNNYRGFVLTLDYLLTNNLNFQQSWQQSITLDNSIGPFRRYKQYEIEFIYGF